MLKLCLGCNNKLRPRSRFCDKCGLATVEGAEALRQILPVAKLEAKKGELQTEIRSLEKDKEFIGNDLRALNEELTDIVAKIEKVLSGYFKQR